MLRSCSAFWMHRWEYAFESELIPEKDLRINSEVMPHMRKTAYRGIRKAMNERGLHGHIWHVGHACPDPSKKSPHDEEDFGWNLFAQHAADNTILGHCTVSCSEAEYLGAYHVRCVRGNHCVRTCDSADDTRPTE